MSDQTRQCKTCSALCYQAHLVERECVPCTRASMRALRTELADHKAKMVGLLADAYEKGRRFNEDTDDRTSGHD